MKNANTLFSFKPALLWAFFIFILCVIPGSSLPHYTWTDLLSVDKLIHCFIFFVQVVLLKKALENKSTLSVQKQNTIALVCAIPYGGILELMQSYLLTDRYGSWFDFLANTAGAVLGVLLFKKVSTIKN